MDCLTDMQGYQLLQGWLSDMDVDLEEHQMAAVVQGVHPLHLMMHHRVHWLQAQELYDREHY